jgi:hypothetical protein
MLSALTKLQAPVTRKRAKSSIFPYLGFVSIETAVWGTTAPDELYIAGTLKAPEAGGFARVSPIDGVCSPPLAFRTVRSF